MIDRRQFVTATTVGLIGVGMSGPFASIADAGPLVGFFRSKLGSSVELQGDSWHLAKLVELRESPSSAALEQFTLVFRLAGDEPITEGIYTLTIGGLKGPLFVQPAGADDTGSYGVASISRLLK